MTFFGYTPGASGLVLNPAFVATRIRDSIATPAASAARRGLGCLLPSSSSSPQPASSPIPPASPIGAPNDPNPSNGPYCSLASTNRPSVSTETQPRSPTNSGQTSSRDVLDGVVIIHPPILRSADLRTNPSTTRLIEDGMLNLSTTSNETQASSPKNPNNGEQDTPHFEKEFVVPIDINAFIQDLERSFLKKRQTDLPQQREELLWRRVWDQFLRDLPRQRLAINGTVHTVAEDVLATLGSLGLCEPDARLLIMMVQQCVLAMPFEILQTLHADHERGIFVGEMQSFPEASAKSSSPSSGTGTTDCLAKGSISPKRVRIDIQAQASPLAGRSQCWVTIQKSFRVFTLDENANDRTIGALEVVLDFDIINDKNVLMIWKWRVPCQAPSPASSLPSPRMAQPCLQQLSPPPARK